MKTRRCLPGALAMLLFVTLIHGNFAGAQNSTNSVAANAAVQAAKAKREREVRVAMQAADDRAAEEARLRSAHEPADPAATLVLHEGDPLEFKLLRELKSNTATIGEPVQFALEKDVVVDGKVVVKVGSRAIGEVVWAEKHTLQVEGILLVRLDYLRVGERKVLLRGSLKLDKSGVILNHDVTLKEGTAVKGFVADDTKLPPAL